MKNKIYFTSFITLAILTNNFSFSFAEGEKTMEAKSSKEVANYNIKVTFSAGKIIQFPDFTLQFIDKADIDAVRYTSAIYRFLVKNQNQEQEIRAEGYAHFTIGDKQFELKLIGKDISRMTELMLYDIIWVQQLHFIKKADTDNGDIVIAFDDGHIGRIYASEWDNEDYNYFQRLITESLSRKKPLAVSLTSEGKITEMRRGTSDHVLGLGESNQDQIEVSFQKSQAIYKLRKGHPNFDRLAKVLRQAQQDKGGIWFAFTVEIHTLVLTDVIKPEKNTDEK